MSRHLTCVITLAVLGALSPLRAETPDIQKRARFAAIHENEPASAAPTSEDPDDLWPRITFMVEAGGGHPRAGKHQVQARGVGIVSFNGGLEYGGVAQTSYFPEEWGVEGFPVSFDFRTSDPTSQPLLPGTYEDAQHFWDREPGEGPAMWVNIDNAMCPPDQLDARFEVYQADRGPDGEVQRFAATFEQTCRSTGHTARGIVIAEDEPDAAE